MIIKKHNEIQNKTEEKKISQPVKETQVEENVDLFDIDNIDFSQRQERRRGNRRRGYRRIDDRNLISRAQEEAGSIRDAAAKEGYKEGIEKATTDIENVRDTLKAFMNAKQEVFDSIAPDILDISLDIARKIIKKEVEQDPKLVLGVISDVLKTISKEESKITVKVNPFQLDLVTESLPQIIQTENIDARVNAISDDTIEEGSCVVETQNGIVDATITTQLEIIKEAFKGM